jgi:hemerythrin
MPFMVWSENLSVGVEELDSDHKRIVAMLNELYDGIAAQNGKELLAGLLDRLEAFTENHFANEEKLFAVANYPEAEAHMKEHNQMAAWSRKTLKEFRSGPLGAPSLEAMSYLKDWLSDHILYSDKRYGPHLNDMGIH